MSTKCPEKFFRNPWSNAYHVDTPFVGRRMVPRWLFWQCCSLPFIDHCWYSTSALLGQSLSPKQDLVCHLPPVCRDLIKITTRQVTQAIIYKQETMILISQYGPLIILSAIHYSQSLIFLSAIHYSQSLQVNDYDQLLQPNSHVIRCRLLPPINTAYHYPCHSCKFLTNNTLSSGHHYSALLCLKDYQHIREPQLPPIKHHVEKPHFYREPSNIASQTPTVQISPQNIGAQSKWHSNHFTWVWQE